MSGALPEVWILQPRIEHYRLPVFDRLAAAGADRFRLKVLGPMRNGEAAGGGRRDYFIEFPYRQQRWVGTLFHKWPSINQYIREKRPAVVVVNTHLRHPDCWQLPKICRDNGATAVAWSKVHSFSGAPAPLLKVMKRRMFERFELFIVYGELARSELRNLGIPQERIFVAQNTVDTAHIFERGDEIRRRAVELRRRHGLDDARVLLSIARFDPEKRLSDLLAAWPRLREADPDLRLVLVGDGPLLDDLRDRAAAIDRERILLIGRAPEGDDYAWIAAADATIQCGAVGLAMNQSMALGVPTVIADEIGSDTEILVDGRTGWRYPRGDIRRLAETVEEALFTSEARQRITTAAQVLLRDHASIQKMTQSMSTCIDRALGLRQQKREHFAN